jgi:hypothetical protein
MESQHSEQVLPPRSGFLYDGTRKLLPGLFFILFVTSGTGVLILNRGQNTPVPSNYVNGFAIAFAVLIALIAIGNFLLYARKRMRLMRSTSGSERSSRIDGERDAWHIRLNKLWDEAKDRPRRLVQEFALRRVLKRNSRKGSVSAVSRNRELSVIELSPSEGGYRDPDLASHGTTPVDRINRDIDLERGESPSERVASRDLNPTTTKTRRATEPSRIAKNRSRMSHDPEYQKHNLTSSSTTSRISTAATSNSLWGTHQGPPRGRAAPAGEMNFSTMQTRLARPVLPEDMLGEYTLCSRSQRRPRASQIPRINKADPRVLSETSTEGYKAYTPTDKWPSNIRVLHLEIIQQDDKFTTSKTPDIEKQNFNPHTSLIDWITPNLKEGEEACPLRFDHVNKDLYRTHISKWPLSTGSIEKCGNTGSQGATDIHASDANRAHSGPADDCDSFASSTKTSYQDTSTPSSSSPELAPQIPRTDHESSASKFTSRFIQSINGKLTRDDEEHETHPMIAMPPHELPDENGLIREEMPQ